VWALAASASNCLGHLSDDAPRLEARLPKALTHSVPMPEPARGRMGRSWSMVASIVRKIRKGIFLLAIGISKTAAASAV
jgi:hypothetical protein